MVDMYLNYGEDRVENNAGGQVFSVSPMERLERFLIIGSDTGTFYVDAPKHTVDNVLSVKDALDKHGIEAVKKIIEVGSGNRAPKHDPVLLALAMAVSHTNDDVRMFAIKQGIPSLVRTGTHLFHFVAYATQRRGWGRSFRDAIITWYASKDTKALAQQLMKYKQRDGWSHRDILRLTHPNPADWWVKDKVDEVDSMFSFVIKGEFKEYDGSNESEALAWMQVANRAGKTEDINELVRMIEQYELPREVLPTSALKDARVWSAMLPHMGYTALLRNLRNMGNYGMLVQGSDDVRLIIDRLSDAEGLRRSRVHPAQIFQALKAIGWNSSSSVWDSRQTTCNAPSGLIRTLEDAFYASFDNVVPTNKSILHAMDVSGSMRAPVSSGLGSCAEWTALMAMVSARTERNSEFVAFSDRVVEFPLTGNESLQEVVKKMNMINFGGTDAGLAIKWAADRRRKYDAFFMYTDNETWGSRDVATELRSYRKKMGVNSYFGAVGMSATNFTIGDPKDTRTVNVVGMDTSVPAFLSDFIRG